MQHVIVYFKHDIRDIPLYSNAVGRLRQLLRETGAGEYLGDDMAIDGGDAEAVFRGPCADKLYETIRPILRGLAFMDHAKVTLVYGPLESGNPTKTHKFRTHDA